MFVVWRDPQRPIWGDDWPYQLTPQIGPSPPLGSLPPGRRIPIEVHDPQRPIWGVDWQYGYRIVSQAPAPSLGSPPTPPPGSPWGITGAGAPDLEAYGYYDPWRTPPPVQVATLITAPFVPAAPPPSSQETVNLLRATWEEATWPTQIPVQIATLIPPPPATNPAPQSRVRQFQIRLAWEEPTWPVQTGGFIGDLPQPPPVPPQKPPFMPQCVGLLLWEAIQALEQAGVLVPATLGYFSEYPVSVIWVPPPDSGTTQVAADGSIVSFPTDPGPSLVIAQVPAAGLHAAPNSPVTLTCYEYPISVVFP